MKRTYLYSKATNRFSHVSFWLVVSDHLGWQLYCTAEKQTTKALSCQSQSSVKHVDTLSVFTGFVNSVLRY